MSKISIEGNASGTGTFTIASPSSNTNRTLSLPDATTTLVGTDATQTLTNKTIQGGAVNSGTAQASTSGTSIDFTGIPSWVKRITVMLSDVSTNGSSNPLIQLGDSGGVETTGYVVVGAFTGSSTGQSSYTTGFGFQSGSSGNVISGFLTCCLLNSSNLWVASGLITIPSFVFSIAGNKTLSATLDRVRITTVNGTDTFDAGSINILYE